MASLGVESHRFKYTVFGSYSKEKNLARVTDESKIRIFDAICWRYMYGLVFTLIADADLVVHFVVSE